MPNQLFLFAQGEPSVSPIQDWGKNDAFHFEPIFVVRAYMKGKGTIP